MNPALIGWSCREQEGGGVERDDRIHELFLEINDMLLFWYDRYPLIVKDLVISALFMYDDYAFRCCSQQGLLHLEQLYEQHLRSQDPLKIHPEYRA